MIPGILVHLADTSKVASFLLPPDIMLERLLQDIANTDEICTKKSSFGRRKKIKDVCHWNGVVHQKERLRKLNFSD